MFKYLTIMMILVSTSVFAGEVEVDWQDDGTTGITVLSVGLLNSGETTLSKCLDNAKRISKLVGEETVGQITCTLINDGIGYTVFLRKRTQ